MCGVLRQTGGRTNLITRPQSAMRGPKPLRCCSPIIRAGFVVGQTNGQSLPVTERHPAVGRKSQQVTQVDRCVDISFVGCSACRALPGWFTLEFRVYSPQLEHVLLDG